MSKYPPDERDAIQDIIASLAILKADTMRVMWNCTGISDLLDLVQSLQERLHAWRGRLPHTAQLRQQSSGDYAPLKTSIYYVHLLHLGATMLIFRRSLGAVLDMTPHNNMSSKHLEVLDDVFQSGIDAAQHTARILSVVRRASQSVRHCWITM